MLVPLKPVMVKFVQRLRLFPFKAFSSSFCRLLSAGCSEADDLGKTVWANPPHIKYSHLTDLRTHAHSATAKLNSPFLLYVKRYPYLGNLPSVKLCSFPAIGKG